MDPDLERLVREGLERYRALTPEQKREHDEAQRQSWVRGEMAMGESAVVVGAGEGPFAYAEQITDVLSGVRYVTQAEHDRRVTELLEANNALLERARRAEDALDAANSANDALYDSLVATLS